MPEISDYACDAGQLIELAKRGEPVALDHAIKCYSRRLMVAGRKVCGNPTDAHDAVQDAMLSAVRGLADFRGEGTVEGWLVRMVSNACHKITRGQKNDPRLHTTEVDVSDSRGDPEVQAGRAEILRAIEVALASLSPTDRLMVMLADVDGLTGPEIAQQVQLTHPLVRTRLSRARKKLRLELESKLPSTAR